MFMRLLVVFALCAVATHAQLSAYISADELSSRQTIAKKNLLEPECLKGTYYNARLLEVTKEKGINCDCNKIGKMVKSKLANPLDVYYGLKAASLCHCTVKPLRSVEDAIEENILSGDINKFGGAALAAKAMKVSITLSDTDIVGKVAALMQPSGLFRTARKATGSSNIKNTKLALQILTEYNDISGVDDTISEIATGVSKLLADTDNEKVSDPTLVSYLHGMTGKKPNMEGKGASTAARIFAVTESLIAMRHTEGSMEYSNMVESLIIMMSYKARPVHIGIDGSNQFSYNSDKGITTQIAIKDAFGKQVSNSDIEVIQTKKDGKDKNIFSGSLTDGKVDLTGNKKELTPGRYGIGLSVMLPDRTKPILNTAAFTVTAKLKVHEVNAGITTDKNFSDIDLSSINSESDWSDEVATANKNEYIHIGFTVSTPKKTGTKFQKPHQCFVKFTHKDTGVSSYFIASTKSSYSGKGSGNVYGVSVYLKKEMETFMHKSGIYSVSVLSADSIYDAVDYTIGTVTLAFPRKDEKDDPLYVKSLLHASDVTLKAMPEITHKMREPPKNAPPIMSVLFTILTAAPGILFVYYILTLVKPNLNLLQGKIPLAYIAAVGAVCILYALYWLMVPGFLFYDTIKYLIISFPVLTVLARYAVVDIVGARNRNKK